MAFAHQINKDDVIRITWNRLGSCQYILLEYSWIKASIKEFSKSWRVIEEFWKTFVPAWFMFLHRQTHTRAHIWGDSGIIVRFWSYFQFFSNLNFTCWLARIMVSPSSIQIELWFCWFFLFCIFWLDKKHLFVA